MRSSLFETSLETFSISAALAAHRRFHPGDEADVLWYQDRARPVHRGDDQHQRARHDQRQKCQRLGWHGASGSFPVRLIAVNHSFHGFPFAEALTFRTTTEDFLLVIGAFAAAAYRGIQSLFCNVFSSSHSPSLLYEPYQAADARSVQERTAGRKNRRH